MLGVLLCKYDNEERFKKKKKEKAVLFPSLQPEQGIRMSWCHLLSEMCGKKIFG